MLIMHKYDEDYQMYFELANYTENGNLYVGLIVYDEEEKYYAPWQNLTVNLSVKCKPNCAYIDTNNNGYEIIDWLEQNKLGHCTGNLMPSGWCVYPEFEFDMEALMEHVTEDYRKADE